MNEEIKALRNVDNVARYLLLELNQNTPPTPEVEAWMKKMGEALAAVPAPQTKAEEVSA